MQGAHSPTSRFAFIIPAIFEILLTPLDVIGQNIRADFSTQIRQPAS
jgi:hypothetical protein